MAKETMSWTYTIPEDMTAEIKDGKIVVRKKESEDDRIRKGLVYHLKELQEWKIGTMSPIKTKEHYDAWIAYLEKQKEQKPVEDIDYSGLNDLERTIHRGFLSAGVENVPVTIIKETAKECLTQMKPAEWNEEDEKMLSDLRNTLSCLMNAGAITFKTKKKFSNWLKDLRPQKPVALINGVNGVPCPTRNQIVDVSTAEWSEEDEAMRDNILRVLSCFAGTAECESNPSLSTSYPLYRREIDWLKSLRLQPKPELTLLDENIINAAVAFVEQNNHFNSWRGIDKRVVIKALRTIKPHWKPSEVQMEALAWYSGNYDVPPTGDKAIKSLYNDLKKL